MIEPFVVKHYSGDKSPTIKGNGFDGLIIGEDRQEAEEFISFLNKIIEERNNALRRVGYYLGSRPLEPKEADNQWFLVGEAGEGIVGGKFAAFQSESEAFEYIKLKNGRVDYPLRG